MNDEIAVGISHRVADGRKEVQPLGEIARVLAAPLDNRFALDELHHHVGPAVFAHAAVEQSRDTRMFEASQNLALRLKAFEVRDGFAPDELQCNLLLELSVGTRGAIHLAHAAPAEKGEYPVCADARAWCEAECGVGWCFARHSRFVENAVVTVHACEQGGELAMECRISRADAFERGVPLLARQIEDFIQRGFDLQPFGRAAQGAPVSVASSGARISRLSQARALTQSRRTVRSVSPSASAVSFSS